MDLLQNGSILIYSNLFAKSMLTFYYFQVANLRDLKGKKVFERNGKFLHGYKNPVSRLHGS